MTHEERLLAMSLISEEGPGHREREEDAKLQAQEDKSLRQIGAIP